MQESVREQAFRRLVFVFSAILAVTLIIVSRLLYWQVARHPELATWGQAVHHGRAVVPAERGTIWDRGGHPLAMDIYTYEVSAAPQMIANPRRLAEKLAPLLDRNVIELEMLLSREDAFVKVADEVPMEIGEMLRQSDFIGLQVQPEPRRAYPQGDLASHLLGFVSTEPRGYYGVEGYYDGALAGVPGERSGEQDPFGRDIVLGVQQYDPPRPGADVVLTLDRALQAMVEEQLEKAIQDNGAESGSILVMDPRTGALLAMASRPHFDPNAYAQVPEALFINPAVAAQWEPGSIFKVITMAAALDSGIFTPQSAIYDPGMIVVGGRPLYNWDRAGHGTVDMTTLLSLSLNVGAATLSTTMGSEVFYDYVKRFGFGAPTGVDLAGEAAGSVVGPGHVLWHPSNLGTNAFGQGIALTPLQMAAAMAAIANGGNLMRPYVVQRLIGEEGSTVTEPQVIRRVISEETSRQLRTMLAEVVKSGVELAAVPGYRVGGKTGTAEVPIPGGYHPTWTITAFVGFAPVDDPQVVVLVRLDKPTSAPWGSLTAAPAFKLLAQKLFVYLGIPPDDQRLVAQR